ncbi:hypothetical protein OIU76_022780 [Salix suchowensis]|nr:hypothetical protein OIU76_022780 [Salix suchowensis]
MSTWGKHSCFHPLISKSIRSDLALPELKPGRGCNCSVELQWCGSGITANKGEPIKDTCSPSHPSPAIQLNHD